MKIERYTLENCREIRGTAVVIDVLRAFTTAAYAYHAGAREIILTDTVENAFRLKERFADSLLVGRTPDNACYQDRVRRSSHGKRFVEPGHIAFPVEDLTVCLEIDRFDFAMRVNRETGLYILCASLPSGHSMDGPLRGSGLE